MTKETRKKPGPRVPKSKKRKIVVTLVKKRRRRVPKKLKLRKRRLTRRPGRQHLLSFLFR